MNREKIRYGIIILAAGNSSRLGQPKQLLLYKGATMIEHVTHHALSIEGAATIIVTGAYDEAVKSELMKSAVPVIHNANWAQGMASSIQTGLAHLLSDYPHIEACILSVCDQPYLNEKIFRQLIAAHKINGCEMVASSYANTIGTPVLFNKRFFNDLNELHGQEGAKKILWKYETNVCLLPFPKGEIDIDTLEDYIKLISND